MNKATEPPRMILIAGLNGAGKTTFAQEYLPKEAGRRMVVGSR
jgi:uridine kinase